MRCLHCTTHILRIRSPVPLRNELQAHYKKLDVTGGAEATADTVDFILEEMGRFCEQELAPLNTTGDEEGCTYVLASACAPANVPALDVTLTPP